MKSKFTCIIYKSIFCTKCVNKFHRRHYWSYTTAQIKKKHPSVLLFINATRNCLAVIWISRKSSFGKWRPDRETIIVHPDNHDHCQPLLPKNLKKLVSSKIVKNGKGKKYFTFLFYTDHHHFVSYSLVFKKLKNWKTVSFANGNSE